MLGAMAKLHHFSIPKIVVRSIADNIATVEFPFSCLPGLIALNSAPDLVAV